ncbi:MAG TPA: hypothetical protein VKP59_06655 [Candidatus Thermoplasmatota archaeon]|nr:hypothetical protein [Candidatus Thermoplasmatota archaeon]
MSFSVTLNEGRDFKLKFLLNNGGKVAIDTIKIYEGGAKPLIIIASILSCVLFFGVLVFYEIQNSPITLLLLIRIVAGCFLFEVIFRRITKRTLVTRK